MKILIANPNISTGVTDRLVASGRLVASASTELIPMTAPRGVPYIATRAEAAIGSAVMLEMLAEKRGTFDAAVCAAFGDPGLGGARELFDFAIVGFAKALEPWFAEIVDWHGMTSRCAAIQMLDSAFTSIDDVAEEKEQL